MTWREAGRVSRTREQGTERGIPAGRPCRLVTTSADGSVRQWDPATGREATPPYERHAGEGQTVGV